MKKGRWFYLKCIYGKAFTEKLLFGHKICRVFSANNSVFILSESVERQAVWGQSPQQLA